MIDSYPTVALILGGILILLSFLYKYFLENSKRFIELFYCGHLLVIAGVVTSGFANFAIIIICILIFVIVSISFMIISRKMKQDNIVEN